MSALEFVERQILQDQKLSYFLTPGTYAYFLHKYQNEVLLYLTIVSLIPAMIMYVEVEIREDLEEFYFEVKPWLWVETIIVVIWVMLTLNITYGYLAKVSWGHSFWIAALGFANFLLVSRFAVDQIYRYKYSKHYLRAKRIKEADF
ncbi:hypothetical protein [Halobacterium hubeiense]|uniref:hypothetical protein n=1 Tax=Halobacterium hubeiense TaxID=1407499 RepID=UPI003C750247